MARLVFIALVALGTIYVWRGRDSARGRAIKRLLLLGFAALVILTILFPDTTTLAANWIGIGRGTDLVSYLTSFAVMFLAALVYLKFKRLEDRIATLTSETALREWESELAATGRQPRHTEDDLGGTSESSTPSRHAAS
jgi:small membrane protein